jgi:serine/threonine protein kinase
MVKKVIRRKPRLRLRKKPPPPSPQKNSSSSFLVQRKLTPQGHTLSVCDTRHFRVDVRKPPLGEGAEGMVLASCFIGAKNKCTTVIKSIPIGTDIETRDYISREMYYSYWIQEFAGSFHIAPKFYEHRICHQAQDPRVRILSLVMDKYQGSMLNLVETQGLDVFTAHDIQQMVDILKLLRFFLIVHGDVKLDQFLWRKRGKGGGRHIVLGDYGYAGTIPPDIMKQAGISWNQKTNAAITKASEWAGVDPRQIEFLPKIGWFISPDNNFYPLQWQEWAAQHEEEERNLDALHKTNGSKYIELILPWFDLICFDLDLIDMSAQVDGVPYAGTTLVPEYVWDWVWENCSTERTRLCLARRRRLVDSNQGFRVS